MAKTDQHDFNYKISKNGRIKNDPAEAYGINVRASHTFTGKGRSRDLEKIDHAQAKKKLDEIL
jgi:hypothetical protein